MSKSQNKQEKRGKKIMLGFACALLAVLILAVVLAGKRSFTVGKSISADEITEFYYTESSSTNPPKYQRYHFYAEDGAFVFAHEKREGKHWPLTENDVSLSGERRLTEAEQAEFLSLLEGGTVRKRSEQTATGGSAPSLYLYWKNDRSEYQAFSFAVGKEAAFERFCAALMDEE